MIFLFRLSFAQVFIPMGLWGPQISVDPNNYLVSVKCPTTPANSLTVTLKYNATFQPTVCNVEAQDPNLLGVPLCLCVSGVCEVTGLRVNNTYWTSDVVGVDTIMTSGLTYTVGIPERMSSSTAVPIQFTTGTWKPTCIGSTISAWYDASVAASVRTGAGGASQAANGNNVSVWQDQSGNARDASQATGGNQPVFRSNANASGYPGIELSAASVDFFSLPTTILSGASSNYIFMVSQNNTSGNWARYFDFGSGTTSNYFSAATNGANSRFRITTSGGGGEQGVANGVSVNNNRTLLMFEHTGTAMSIYRDSATTGTAAVATSILPSTIGNTLNYLGKSQYADPYFNGWFQEILIVNSTITAGERIVLEGYYATKWNLRAVLPGAHKYKSGAP